MGKAENQDERMVTFHKNKSAKPARSLEPSIFGAWFLADFFGNLASEELHEVHHSGHHFVIPSKL